VILELDLGALEGKISNVEFGGHTDLSSSATRGRSEAVPEDRVSKLALEGARESALQNN
jgi:hypothetical protein